MLLSVLSVAEMPKNVTGNVPIGLSATINLSAADEAASK
jgi:hypothetical protein